jgi:hypothetical protein
MLHLWMAFAEDWDNNHKVVFDGANKWIIVYPDISSIDIKSDVYSAWKEWTQIRDNAKFLPAIRTIGGDPTTGSQRAGDIYFLINGWKLIVDFTKTNISGILFSDDFDTAYYDENLNPTFPALISSTVNAIETKETVLNEESVLASYESLLAAVAKTMTVEQFLALK